MLIRIRKFIVFLPKIFLITTLLLTISCDETQVKNLGSKVGLRGQDVGNSAVTALQKLAAYERIDYARRRKINIAVQPKEIFTLPQEKLNAYLEVKHYFPDVAVSERIQLYRQLAKAYLALQKLSEGEFGKDSEEAVTAFNTSLSAIKAAPKLPSNASAFLAGVTGFIVNKKQAGDVRRANLNLYSLIRAHRELWEADRPLWEAYLKRVKGSYINNLRSIPAKNFDMEKLRKEVNQPYKDDEYIVQMYKNQEEAKVDDEIAELENYFDIVDQAFLQLEKGHIELSKQKPSYLDAIAELDRITTIVEPMFTEK